jgi:hypothetical protein
MKDNSSQPPRAFMSYSWDDNDHRAWVRHLATCLRGDGIEVTLDQWHAVPGDQLPAFMETAVRDTDFVILICTPRYKLKADGRRGGVGYEGDVMTAEVLTQGNQRKFVPVLRDGEWEEAAPSWALGKYYVDLRNDPYSAEAYQDLVSSLKGQRPVPPPVGADTTSLHGTVNAVVAFAALADLMVSEISSIQYIGHTFGESRRILAFIDQLHKRLKSRIATIEASLDSGVLESVRSFHRRVGSYISEANYVLPTAGDDKYTSDTERLKEHRYYTLAAWDALKDKLLSDSPTRASYETLRNEGDDLWQMAGYRDAAAFKAYMSPRTLDMLRSAGPTEIALVAVLAERGEATESGLVAEGFPKATVVETLNSLMRDGYVKSEDYGTFRATTVGIRILKDLLAKREARGHGNENAG